uniref:WD_REPEATS_REGION domain-containing protein n=1 Tax=Syphacia muris TaxID=451379 RepID=A0A0N5ATL6_9BILA
MEMEVSTAASNVEKTNQRNGKSDAELSSKTSPDGEGSTKSPLFATTLLFNDFHSDLIHHVAFDFHGRRLATVSSDSVICIWDVTPNGSCTKSACWKSHGGPIWKVQWAHPEFGQILATCSFDRHVTIWEETAKTDMDDTLRGKPGERFEKRQWRKAGFLVDTFRDSVTDIKFAPRHFGLMIATCSAQGILRTYEAPDIMNLSQWNLKEEVRLFDTRCSTISWSTNRLTRPLIAACSDEIDLKGPSVAIVEYHENFRKWQHVESPTFEKPCPVSDCSFAPSVGRLYHILAVAARDVYVYKVSLKDGIKDADTDSASPSSYVIELLDVLETSAPKFVQLWRLSWNITGSVLCVASSDGNIRIWKGSLLTCC